MSKRFTRGPKELQKEVLSERLCVACGACTNLCPYIDMVNGRAVIIEPCGLKEGMCYDFCPRTYVHVPSLDNTLFGSHRKDVAIGPSLSVMKGRAEDVEVRSAAQYGGAASALTIYALEQGIIEAAVLAKSYDGIRSKPAIVQNRKEVLECVGSRYIVSPTLEGVLDAIEQGIDKIGVIGTPCQITAARKMQASSFETKAGKVALMIGVFCTWAFSPKAQNYIKELVGTMNLVNFDVPPPPADLFVVQTEEKRLEIPLSDLRKFIMPSCNLCFDMTNEFADIAVGAVEGQENWNTLIVRTGDGKKCLQGAIEAGAIETKPLEKERFNHLCEASLARKRRVLNEIRTQKRGYLTISEGDKSRIFSWDGGK